MGEMHTYYRRDTNQWIATVLICHQCNSAPDDRRQHSPLLTSTAHAKATPPSQKCTHLVQCQVSCCIWWQLVQCQVQRCSAMRDCKAFCGQLDICMTCNHIHEEDNPTLPFVGATPQSSCWWQWHAGHGPLASHAAAGHLLMGGGGALLIATQDLPWNQEIDEETPIKEQAKGGRRQVSARSPSTCTGGSGNPGFPLGSRRVSR